MENKSLYAISIDLINILSLIEDNEGEITEEMDKALTITQDQAAAKMSDYGHAILQLESWVEMAKSETQRIQKLQKLYDNTAKRLKTKVVEAMRLFDMPKVETPTLKLSMRKTATTVIDDIALVPKEYKTVKIEEVADKTAIKKAIQSGTEIDGAHIEENQSLMIK